MFITLPGIQLLEKEYSAKSVLEGIPVTEVGLESYLHSVVE